MLSKTDVPGFFKNTATGAIINNNEDEYKKILNARKMAKENKDLARRVDVLEKELKQLKELILNGNR
jgi:hypothetical protein